MSTNLNLTDRLEVTTIYVNDNAFSLLPEHDIDLNHYLELQEMKFIANVNYISALSMDLWLRLAGFQKEIREDLVERHYGQDAIWKKPFYELLGVPRRLNALNEFNNMLIKRSLPFTFEEVGSVDSRYILGLKK